MMSLMSVFPDTCIDFEETTWIGLVLTSFGEAIRDPVTMISCRGPASAAAVIAGCDAAVGGPCASNNLSERFVSSAGVAGIVAPDCACSETPAPSLSAEVEIGMTVTVLSSQ